MEVEMESREKYESHDGYFDFIPSKPHFVLLYGGERFYMEHRAALDGIFPPQSPFLWNTPSGFRSWK